MWVSSRSQRQLNLHMLKFDFPLCIILESKEYEWVGGTETEAMPLESYCSGYSSGYGTRVAEAWKRA